MEHGEDPTRPTIGASNHGELDQMNRIPDMLGRNFYPGWYSGRKEDFGATLDQARNSSRQGGFCVSEYGAGANVNQHEDNPKQPVTTGQWHPEEWQALLHEAAWPAMKARPFVWGTFVWVMFDFTVSTRHEGGVEGRNDKGLVTRGPEDPEGRLFLLQSQLVGRAGLVSDQPAVHRAHQRRYRREGLFQRGGSGACWSTMFPRENGPTASTAFLFGRKSSWRPARTKSKRAPSATARRWRTTVCGR